MRVEGALLVWLVAALLVPQIGAEDRVAAGVLSGLQEDRADAGLEPLARRADLDAVALERAERIAALPQDKRMSYEEPIGDMLRRSGIVWFRRAAAHLDMVRGYRRPENGILRSWRGHEGVWDKALSPDYESVGAASVRADDGWVVFVAVLLDEMSIPQDMALLERQTFEAVNRVRGERNVAPLREMQELAAVARAHSADMARRDYVAHVNPEGLTTPERVDRAGLKFDKVGENIQMSRGAEDPVDYAVRTWLSSEGHRSLMLDPEFLDTGVGVAMAEDGSLYFTQVFLRPQIR